jgi:hypothetical protein
MSGIEDDEDVAEQIAEKSSENGGKNGVYESSKEKDLKVRKSIKLELQIQAATDTMKKREDDVGKEVSNIRNSDERNAFDEVCRVSVGCDEADLRFSD